MVNSMVRKIISFSITILISLLCTACNTSSYHFEFGIPISDITIINQWGPQQSNNMSNPYYPFQDVIIITENKSNMIEQVNKATLKQLNKVSDIGIPIYSILFDESIIHINDVGYVEHNNQIYESIELLSYVQSLNFGEYEPLSIQLDINSIVISKDVEAYCDSMTTKCSSYHAITITDPNQINSICTLLSTIMIRKINYLLIEFAIYQYLITFEDQILYFSNQYDQLIIFNGELYYNEHPITIFDSLNWTLDHP